MAKTQPVIFTCIGYKADRTKISEAKIAVGDGVPAQVLEHKNFLSDEEREKYSNLIGLLINETLNEVYPGGEGYDTGKA